MVAIWYCTDVFVTIMPSGDLLTNMWLRMQIQHPTLHLQCMGMVCVSNLAVTTYSDESFRFTKLEKIIPSAV